MKAEESKSEPAEIKHILYFNKVLLFLCINGTVVVTLDFQALEKRHYFNSHTVVGDYNNTKKTVFKFKF